MRPTGSNYDLYITSAVQGWLQGLTNYGIVLKEKDDSVWSSMFSDDCSINTPSLVVTYVDEDAPTQTPGVSGGATYYLINKDSEKYLMAAGTTVGSNVTISTTSVTARKVWQFTSLGDCYYSIKCGNYYLTASANGPNAGLTLQSYSSSNNRQKWKVVRNWDGSYHLMTKAAEAARSLPVQRRVGWRQRAHGGSFGQLLQGRRLDVDPHGERGGFVFI